MSLMKNPIANSQKATKREEEEGNSRHKNPNILND